MRKYSFLASFIGLFALLTGAAGFVLTGNAVIEQTGNTNSVGSIEAPGIATDPAGQPIAFSHAHHAGQYEIDCEFCHAYARRGPVAGIPSVERCIGCHRSILTEQPEIQKLFAYWENEEPIPWIRVHNLPDYVRFNHKAHIRANVTCENCHGDVRRMEIAQQVKPLTMGWCLDCHKEREASRDCLVCHY